MKKIIVLIALIINVVCTVQSSNSHHISLTGDGKQKQSYVISFTEAIYTENIVKFEYIPEDNTYIIVYVDHGLWDINDSDYYEDNILIIECNKEDFLDYLEWYAENGNKEDAMSLDYEIEVLESDIPYGKQVKDKYYRFFLARR